MAKERANKIKATGASYRMMLAHVKKVLGNIKQVVPEYESKQGYELAGFVWFQGFNDLVNSWTYPNSDKPGGYDLYADLMAHFIRDVRKDLAAPQLPFVIGVMGLNGMKPPQNEAYFHQAQAAPAALQTAPFWDDDLDALNRRAEKKQPLTPEEEKRLKAGVSNGGYHYLGAARIMAPIGKAFAEAMVNLQNNQPKKP